jgi:hypothetical protein
LNLEAVGFTLLVGQKLKTEKLADIILRHAASGEKNGVLETELAKSKHMEVSRES